MCGLWPESRQPIALPGDKRDAWSAGGRFASFPALASFNEGLGRETGRQAGRHWEPQGGKRKRRNGWKGLVLHGYKHCCRSDPALMCRTWGIGRACAGGTHCPIPLAGRGCHRNPGLGDCWGLQGKDTYPKWEHASTSRVSSTLFCLFLHERQPGPDSRPEPGVAGGWHEVSHDTGTLESPRASGTLRTTLPVHGHHLKVS